MFDQTEPSGAHRRLVTSVLSRIGLANASLEKPASVDKAVTDFADAPAGLWPVSSSEQILESAVSIELQKSAMTPARFARVSHAIDKAAFLFDVIADVSTARSQVRAEIGASEKSAAVASPQFALPAVQRFPLDSKDEVETSAKAFLGHRSCYPLPWRKEAAQNILKAGDRFHAEFSENELTRLNASAGYGIGLVPRIARSMAARGMKIASRVPSHGAETLAAAIRFARYPFASMEEVYQLAKQAAETMDYLDEQFDLRTSYDRDLDYPEDVCFSATANKIAAAQDELVSGGGDFVYDREELANVNPQAFAVLDREMPGKIASSEDAGRVDPEKFQEYMKSAGRPAVVSRVLRGFGVRPMDDVPQLGQVIMDDEINQWGRIASENGGPLVMTGSGHFDYHLTHPQEVKSNVGYASPTDKAGAALGRMGGPVAGGPDGSCVCPACGHTAKHTTGTPCSDTECSECGTKMTRKTQEKSDKAAATLAD